MSTADEFDICQIGRVTCDPVDGLCHSQKLCGRGKTCCNQPVLDTGIVNLGTDTLAENIRLFAEIDGMKPNRLATALQSVNETLTTLCNKEEAREVSLLLHRTTERLLADLWKSIGVVNEHPATNASLLGGLLRKVGEFGTNIANPTVLICRQTEEHFRITRCKVLLFGLAIKEIKG